ncbi:LuxE/PaaK family acyltransferase [Staphylococcus haemolyticus]|uniref:LuxE/PaaK family acyltransferase n=1 Tax=Staphylococcus haemolyticus TaxID=1283 RepID=UPI0015D92463|nr:long-chain fatty acid--CoA ligase [Staphylococcus haemolyticus]
MNFKQIKQYIYQFIEHGSPDDFPTVALELFEYQFNKNRDYKRFCLSQGKTPQTINYWKDIPAVPINAFKHATFSTIPIEEAQFIYMTSGTTRGIKGKNYHKDLDVYDLAMTSFFKKMFLPDYSEIEMAILFPSPKELPNSSLAHYLEVAKSTFGTKNSATYIDNSGIQYTELIQALRQSESNGTPFSLLGASYSIVHLIEYLEEHNLTFILPEGSRILDTGGYKNRSKELPQQEFYYKLSNIFNISKNMCINMYGVTELSTQFYDKGNQISPSIKFGPHWCRSRVVNPMTMKDVSYNEKGILIHYDLANYNSVATIMMEDVGEPTEQGFILHGRTEGSLAKGCSLAVEEFLNSKN